MAIKVRYNKELLEKICERDNCLIDFADIKRYRQDIRIKFICNCGNNGEKQFKHLYLQGGGFCKECAGINKIEKIKKTSLERYGVENILQLEQYKQKNFSLEAKEKRKQLCLERYGVEYFSQAEEVKTKIRKTNLEKYGVENYLQSDVCKEKIRKSNLEKYGVNNMFESEEVKELIKRNNLAKYGVEYPSKLKSVQEKQKATNLIKYGVEFVSQSKPVREKIKQACIESLGVENPSLSEEVRQKRAITTFKNFGVECSFMSKELRDKAKKTSLERYGVENPIQCEEIRDKIKNTNLERYGVENAMQNAEISEKSMKHSYKTKLYTFPCGNSIQVQGYEPFLLDIFVKEGYTFEDIIISRIQVPEIWYENNNKKSRYYCDAYIPKTNTIYEVKSLWTYNKDLEIIHLKKQACINAGYNFELFVFDKKGIILNHIKSY